MELIRARRVTLQICILYKPEKSVVFTQCEPGFIKTMVSWEDEGLFITQSSTKADISAEIPRFRKTKDYLSHRALRRQILISAEIEGNDV